MYFMKNYCIYIFFFLKYFLDLMLCDNKYMKVLYPTKILTLIRSLDVNKANGWDDVSVHMVKICEESLVKPL